MPIKRQRTAVFAGGFGVQNFRRRHRTDPRARWFRRAWRRCCDGQSLARQNEERTDHPHGEQRVYFCRNRAIGGVPARHTAPPKINPTFRACPAPGALLMARSYPPGRPSLMLAVPDDLAVVAELVDAQR